MRVVATYREIQDWVKSRYGWMPKTCWIAHCKELNGFPVRRSPRRHGDLRCEPCPESRQAAIEDALRHLGMMA